MRIAIVTPGFSRDDNDWCIPLLQDLATELNKSHDVRVYSTCYPAISAKYTVKGVPVQSFGDGNSGRLSWALRQYRATNAIVKDYDQKPFDVLHGFWTDGGGVVAARVKRRRSLPTLVTVLAGELTFEPRVNYGKRKRPIAGRLSRYGARQADRLLVQSAFQKSAIQTQNTGLHPVLMNCGTSIDRFSSVGESKRLDGEFPILCVASLVPVKGLEGLIRAFATAQRDSAGMHLHIVGEGTLLPNLQSLARSVSATVTFHGAVDHGQLASYYRGASFCVLNSWFEGFPMVIAEAAACGRATIGANVGAMSSFCPESFLCTPGDETTLAEKLVAAVEHSGPLLPLKSPVNVEQAATDVLAHYSAIAR